MKTPAETRLGLFVLVGIGVIAFLSLRLGHHKMKPENSSIFYAEFNSVDGLEKGTDVEVAGVKVGEVDDITLSAMGRARVKMLVSKNLVLPSDVRAVIFSNGFLGKMYIELEPGPSGIRPRLVPTHFRKAWNRPLSTHALLEPTPAFADEAPATTSSSPRPMAAQAASGPSDALPPGATLPSPGTTVSVNRLVKKLTKIANDIQAVTQSLKGSIGTAEGKDELKRTLKHLDELTANLKDFTISLKKTSPGILNKIDSIANKIDNGVGTIGSLVNKNDVYQSADQSLAHLNSILKKIDEGQGTIGKLVNNPDVYDNLSKTLKKLSGATNNADRMELNVWMRGFYMPRAGTSEGFFTLDLYPRSDKFYRIQVVSTTNPYFTQTTPYTQINGTYVAGPTQVTGTTQGIKFSVEFGEKFGDFDVRAGLIQNSFGVGADYQILKNLFLTFTLYNIGTYDPMTPNPYSRLFLTYTLWNHIWLNAGYYNALNASVASPLIGGGVIINDTTLKYLIAGHLP
jgi:phospholipid/cholesterol/gamma-HCH transport system substrate-binding protein